MWPGYGENLRVLNWIIDRCKNKVSANETEIGYLPNKEDLNLTNLKIDNNDLNELLKIDKETWKEEIKNQKDFFEKFGDKMPKEITHELEQLEKRINQ